MELIAPPEGRAALSIWSSRTYDGRTDASIAARHSERARASRGAGSVNHQNMCFPQFRTENRHALFLELLWY
ncbi:hypothetical protein DPM35_21955 [Mesorhizobium atlanticum]|uniref:Uncharacterized protein n=1 Tax=Mesorhizobium atlanticum TaxID=2233532 RepID=A0A330GMF5_9HYPH|nr:hypothetical protein DPM35_21955 [Mesorhizobium atlanticum]